MFLQRIFPEVRQAIRSAEAFSPFASGRYTPSTWSTPPGYVWRRRSNIFDDLENDFEDFSRTMKPAMDVRELKDKFEVEIEVPGVKKEDLKVEFVGEGGRTLSISGIVKSKLEKGTSPSVDSRTQSVESSNSPENPTTEATEKDGEKAVTEKRGEEALTTNVWSSQRFTGSFMKSFRFPTPIEVDQVKAKYQDGILEIQVPKKLQTQPEEGVKSVHIE